MSSTTPLEINERNEAGEIIATYICSNTTASSNSKDVKGTLSTRVDVVVCVYSDHFFPIFLLGLKFDRVRGDVCWM